ncbi:MAG: zinc-ribbon domain-containing protein [Thermodesulfobacteriota bacterium]
MDVSCKSCGGRFHLPDEKVPPNTVVALPCPKCHEKIVVDTRVAVPAPAEEPELFGDDVELALLCLAGSEDRNQTILAAVSQLGFRAVPADNFERFDNLLRFNRFGLVLLDEGFDPRNGRNPTLELLQAMPMSVRREMIVGLITSRFPTFDSIHAFGLSVDFIMSPQDLKAISQILKKAISEHEQTYKVFTECQQLATK